MHILEECEGIESKKCQDTEVKSVKGKNYFNIFDHLDWKTMNSNP